MKQLQKCLYRYAYGFARRCQEKYFMVYMRKYLKKHIKYRQENNEYDVLIVVVHTHITQYDHFVRQLTIEMNRLTRYLYDKNREIYSRFCTQYAYRLKTPEQHVTHIVQEYETRIDDERALQDIVAFSLQFQDIFYKSDLTAKTKIQEHWFMRLPIYVPCVTLILILNLIKVDIVRERVRVGFMVAAYALSIFLVVIRFHQSVAADTKKICSEIYTKRKNELFVALLEKN